MEGASGISQAETPCVFQFKEAKLPGLSARRSLSVSKLPEHEKSTFSGGIIPLRLSC